MSDTLDLDALIEEAIQTAIEASKQNRLKRDNPYVPFLIKVLLPHKQGLHRSYVFKQIEAERKAKGLSIPPKFEQAVQRRFEDYCSQCRGFNRPSSDDLFYFPTRKGSGVWAVHIDRATSWLTANSKP